MGRESAQGDVHTLMFLCVCVFVCMFVCLISRGPVRGGVYSKRAGKGRKGDGGEREQGRVHQLTCVCVCSKCVCVCTRSGWLSHSCTGLTTRVLVGKGSYLRTHSLTQRPSLFVSLLVIRAQAIPKGDVCSLVLKPFSKNCCMQHPPLGYTRV